MKILLDSEEIEITKIKQSEFYELLKDKENNFYVISQVGVKLKQ